MRDFEQYGIRAKRVLLYIQGSHSVVPLDQIFVRPRDGQGKKNSVLGQFQPVPFEITSPLLPALSLLRSCQFQLLGTPRRQSTIALEAGVQTAVHAKIHSLGGARRSE